MARLGDASIPLRYQLQFRIDPSQPTYSGLVTIDVDLRESLHTLWLHQRGLTIHRAELVSDERTAVLEPVADALNSDLLGLRARYPLTIGRAKLQIEFSGVFGDIGGLFRQQAGKRWYTYSDFEPIDARAAFPSYDDPRFKVPFEIELRVPAGLRAFANTPELDNQVTVSGERTFRFAPTRPLPTYLVAVAVGPFDVIESIDSGAAIRVIAPKGSAEAGRFALESTRGWLEYLERYLGMPMPFRKLDFIAVPVFNGAMENPGLVTVTAGILLTGPNASASAKRRVAGVIAHELAHLWFGDLLTPNYWDDLWLNEAFATWLSDKVLADWDPQHAREILDIADKTAAYPLDHRLDGRAVRQPIRNDDDITAAFDAITYRKGGALLTMLEGWLGDEPMREVVQAYLHANVDGTVKAEDLIGAFEASNGPELRELFWRYLSQTGIANIAVEVECADEVRVSLRQSRYLSIGTAAQSGTEDRKRLWHVPVCLRFPTEAKEQRLCVLMNKESLTITLPIESCPPWVLPNDRESGYYHYQLSAPAFDALLRASLDPRERVGLLANIAASWHNGGLSFQEVMPLLALGAADFTPSIQQIIIPLLYTISQNLVGPQERAAFESMIRILYGAKATALGLRPNSGDNYDDRMLRPGLLRLVGDLGGDLKIRATARARVEEWLTHPVRVDYELLDALLHLAAIDGDRVLHKLYVGAFQGSVDPLASELILGALLSFREPVLFARSLAVVRRRGLGHNTTQALARAMTDRSKRAAISVLLTENRDDFLDKLVALSPTEDRAKLFQVLSLSLSLLCDEQGIVLLNKLAGDEYDTTAIGSEISNCITFIASQRSGADDYFSAQ